jgi:hypothetical protein
MTVFLSVLCVKRCFQSVFDIDAEIHSQNGKPFFNPF